MSSRPRPRCPAGAERACSPAPSPCRVQGRRLRCLRCPRPAPPLPPRSRRTSQRSSNLARGGCCSFCQAPQVPKGSVGGNGNAFAQRPALRHAPLLCALPRLIQEALHVTGPAYDLRRRLRLARTGQHVQVHVLSCVLGQLRVEGLRGCEPPERRLQCCAGWRAAPARCWPARRPRGLPPGHPQQSGFRLGTSAQGARPRPWPAEAVLENCLQGWGPRWTVQNRPGRQGGFAVRLVQGQRLIPFKVACHLLKARARPAHADHRRKRTSIKA